MIPEAATLRLRPAMPDDAELLFAWVNSPDSLAGKLSTGGPIPWETHQDWLQRKLKDPDCAIWIGEYADEPAGQVRVERRDGMLEVDVFVDRDKRGGGLGRTLLAALAAQCRERFPGDDLLARVKPDNIASQKLFRAAGYELSEERADHLVFTWRPA